jgi:peptidyl-prolyl cis-trans isomerase D
MLNAFRSRGLSSVVYGVVIIATILVFVIQFNPSAGKKTASLDEQCAAKVRSWCINPKDHLAAFRILIPRGPQGELQTQRAKQMGLMKVALDGLVERELLVNEADRIGISVTDDEVTDEIYNGFIHVSVPSDQPGLAAALNVTDGKVPVGFRDQKTKRFDMKVYERSIKAIVGRSPTEFREEQARELLAAKMRELVKTPVRVSEVEALESYIDEKSTANVATVQVRQSWAAKYAVPTPASDVDNWGKEPANQAIIDGAVKARSTSHLREILVKFISNAAPAAAPAAGDKAAAKEKVDKALARVKSGEPFAKVAKEVSDDLTASSGGDVGEKSDNLEIALREAADKLKPGETTETPIEGDTGYAILMREAPKTEADLAQLRKDTVRELYVKTKAPDAAKSLADRILTGMKSGKAPDGVVKDALAPIVASYAAAHPPAAVPAHHAAAHASVDGGAPVSPVDGGASAEGGGSAPPTLTDTPDTDPTRPQVNTSAAFNKGGDPLPTLPSDSTTQLLKFAFSPTVKDDDVLGESLKADDGFTVVQLKQHKTATKEEFDKDRDTYLATLVGRKEIEALSLYVKRLKEQAKGEIKIDEKYMAEKTGSKDGGLPLPGEDEEEGP